MLTKELYFDKIDELNKIYSFSEICIQNSKKIIEKLSFNSKLFPSRLIDSEDSILFDFKNGDEIFHLEIYNDGDIGYIIANEKGKK